MKQLEVIYPFDIEVLAETKRILRLLIHMNWLPLSREIEPNFVRSIVIN